MKILPGIFSKIIDKKISSKNFENIKRIMSYIKPYKKRFIQSAIFMALTGVLTSSLMYLIKPVMNDIFLNKKSYMILPLMSAILIISFLKGLIQYLHNYLISYVCQNVIRDLRNELFSHIMKLSLDYYQKNSTGNIMSKLTNDINLIQNFVMNVPADFFKNIFTILGLSILVFYLNAKLALITVLVFPLAFFPISLLGKKMRIVSHKLQKTMAELYSDMHQAIMGIKVIESYWMRRNKETKFREKNTDYYSNVMRSAKITAMSAPIMEFIGALGISIIIGIGGFLVVKGKYTQGDFFSFIGAVVSMYLPLKSLSGINNYIQQVMVSAERIFGILDHKPKIIEKENAMEIHELKNEIVFENVTFSFDYKKVLENINIKIPRGKFVAFVGQSGSGKTTLINLLMRFYNIENGKILIDNIDIKDYKLKSLRKLISIVPQEVILFHGTLRENLTDGFFIPTDDDINKALIKANAYDFVYKLPNNINTDISEGGTNFSGGEKQRLCLARALIRKPRILILDEATSSLDSVSEGLIRESIKNMMGEITIIVIAHRLSTVKDANMIYIMDHGRIVDFGEHEELLETSKIYKILCDSQFAE